MASATDLQTVTPRNRFPNCGRLQLHNCKLDTLGGYYPNLREVFSVRSESQSCPQQMSLVVRRKVTAIVQHTCEEYCVYAWSGV